MPLLETPHAEAGPAPILLYCHELYISEPVGAASGPANLTLHLPKE
jgi:hypothetical protein